MSNKPKLNAKQICLGAAHRIRSFLYSCENCALCKDQSRAYFVFEFTVRDADGWQDTGRFTVLGAMIEDGIMSERQLHAALWHTLGQIRGMV